MSKISTRLKGSVASLALFTGALLAAPALAQQVAVNQAGEIETVVVTGTAHPRAAFMIWRRGPTAWISITSSLRAASRSR
jgi:hypothetical protein